MSRIAINRTYHTIPRVSHDVGEVLVRAFHVILHLKIKWNDLDTRKWNDLDTHGTTWNPMLTCGNRDHIPRRSRILTQRSTSSPHPYKDAGRDLLINFGEGGS